MGRRLLWIPIVHGEADLGKLGGAVKRLYVRKLGIEGWERHAAQVRALWERIAAEIARLKLDYGKVRLYQDGLPACGEETARRIVEALAKAGSENHRLLLALMRNGARLMGTESPALLLEEYKRMRNAEFGMRNMVKRQPADCIPHSAFCAPNSSILGRRDAYIAKRINDTLGAGETGVVFLGALHSLKGPIAPDVQVARIEAHFREGFSIGKTPDPPCECVHEPPQDSRTRG